jgi:hypothetical protein
MCPEVPRRRQQQQPQHFPLLDFRLNDLLFFRNAIMSEMFVASFTFEALLCSEKKVAS